MRLERQIRCRNSKWLVRSVARHDRIISALRQPWVRRPAPAQERPDVPGKVGNHLRALAPSRRPVPNWPIAHPLKLADAPSLAEIIIVKQSTMEAPRLQGLDRDSFEQLGYAIVRGFLGNGELDDLQAELEELGEHVVGRGFSPLISAGYEMTPAQQSLLYDRLKYLPALSRLSASKSVLGFCKELGLGMPSLMGSSNMRLDKPGDDRHLFAWHQDTLYLLGSTNAVTIWVPLGDVDLIRGTIQVIPGSHKLGILPFKRISDKPILKNLPFLQRDLVLDVDVSEEPHTMIATRGDVVVFKQMLLHRSTPNNSRKIRWTAQLRITDLAEPEFMRQHFPTGDKTNIFFVDYPGFKPSLDPSG